MRKVPIYLEISRRCAIFVSDSILNLIRVQLNTSPPPRQVFRSGQPSTEVGVGAFFLIFRIFLENYLQIRKSHYIFALEIGSQTIGKEI